MMMALLRQHRHCYCYLEVQHALQEKKKQEKGPEEVVNRQPQQMKQQQAVEGLRATMAAVNRPGQMEKEEGKEGADRQARV